MLYRVDSCIFKLLDTELSSVPVVRGLDLIVGTGTTLTGENVYYPDAQLQAVNTSPNVAALFRLIVKNAGNAQDTFRLSGRGDTPGWKVRYFDAPTGGSDVSALIKSNAYLLSVDPATGRELRIEVTPDGTVPQNQAKDVPLSVRSEGDSLYSDQITARAVQSGVQPTPAPNSYNADASIRLASETDYSGGGTYSPTPNAAQTKTATASSNIGAITNWRVQNTGTSSDTFKLTLPLTPAGWSVHLFDALDGGNDITTTAQSTAGYPTSLAPGGAIELRLEAQPNAGTTGTLSTNLSAASASDPTKTDVCAANTTTGSASASPAVTFDGTTTRACAGGIDNALHKLTFTLDAAQNGTALGSTPLTLSFENNVGHNYGTVAAPDIRRRAKIFDSSDPANPWKESLNVMTGTNGQTTVTVLSSDVISQPRLVARRTVGSQISTLGGVKCDFAAVTSKRGFPDPVVGAYAGWESNDTGWTCDLNAIDDVNKTAIAKLHLKFHDATGAEQPVMGHQVRVSFDQLKILGGTQIYDVDETSGYISLSQNGNDLPFVVVTTDSSGMTQLTLKIKTISPVIKSVQMSAQNTSQWVK